MFITISPLDLTLDKENPRFVVIEDNSEESIRKYMAMYEDVCQLTKEINDNNGLLLGERIVAIKKDNQYIVMEGNRRTVALQFLLNRDLIPDGFQHQIPVAKEETLANIQKIDVDIAPNRQYAITLMAKRHIKGVKDWKPLAKKQFFASMFANGSSIEELSLRTGIPQGEIRKDIREYKLFLKVSQMYKQDHPDFDNDLITHKIDPFLRIFSTKKGIGETLKKSPTVLLKMRYDTKEEVQSDLPDEIFNKILKLIFKATIVDKVITTRNNLFDIEGIKELLESCCQDGAQRGTNTPDGEQHGTDIPNGEQHGTDIPNGEQ
ncbi:hypothetical protein, partial [Aneurinibacillus thermoaerophilus]